MDRPLVEAALAPWYVDRAAGLREALGRWPAAAIRLRPGVDPHDLPFPVDPVDWHPRGWIVRGGARPGATLSFAAADFYIQDAASLLSLMLLQPQPGERLCDLCAAPGGKATGILEDLGDSGWLVANEAVQSRRAALEFNLARHGGVRGVVTGLDPEELADRLAGYFDGVLVDAPCSGQSLVSRGKQTVASFLPRTIAHCAARQARILAAAARLVRPGGRLVYATCTFACEENERQIERFLDGHPAWSLAPCPAAQRWQSERGPGHYRLWPDRDDCSGGYAAVLVKARDAESAPAARRPPRQGPCRPSAWPDGFREWGELRDAEPFRSGAQVFGWPEGIDPMLLSVAETGPEVGFRKGSTWFPAYALAMRRDPCWSPRQRVTLDDAAAGSYVQGKSVPTPIGGWAVATWRGRPLGWLKGDGAQGKNHLPKPARLPVVSPLYPS